MATPPVLVPPLKVTAWGTLAVDPLKDISVGASLPAPQSTIMSSVPLNVKEKDGFVAVENTVNPVESTTEMAIF